MTSETSSAPWYSRLLSRAAFAWLKRPVMERPSWPTMCARAARKATSASPRRFWRMNKNVDNPRRALGKGLSALLPTRPTAQPPAEPTHLGEEVAQLPIELIEPNPLQPRRVFQHDRIEELAQSIRANGIIQPLVVRRRAERYQLVAGERRWRAAKIAGVARVPAVIQDIPDERLLEITLIENIQREDLNAIETAQAFDRLCRELQLNHEEGGRRKGKDRSTTAKSTSTHQPPPAASARYSATHRRAQTVHRPCTLSPYVAHRRTPERRGREVGSARLVGAPGRTADAEDDGGPQAQSGR